MSEARPPEPSDARDVPDPREAFRHGRRLLDAAYRRTNVVIDYGQRHAFRFLYLFLPEPEIARKPSFQQILVSRFLSDAGQQSLAYGALISVFRGGGTAFDAALLGTATLLPPAILGLYGGAIADALPKRIALAGVYNLQAILCFATPGLIGTDLVAMMVLLFAVNTLGQVSGPTESSVLPVVANEGELASGASLISFISTLGSAFGTALLAPVLVRAFGVDAVIYVAGVLLLLAAGRVFDLRHHGEEPDKQTRVTMSLLRQQIGARQTITWLARQPAVATMIFVAVLAGTAQIVLQTLAPRYVQVVLDLDPADAVYVFAPSAAGLVTALALTPRLVKKIGERSTALLGFVTIGASLVGLGLVPQITEIDAVNPLRVLTLVGPDLTPKLRTAALLAIPVGFGLALATTTVQIYVNRRVPLSHQGRTFALQSSLKNGVAIIPLLSLGAIVTVTSVEAVLIAMPVVLISMAYGLIQLSRHFGGHAPRGNLDVLASYWEESESVENLTPG
jgi:Na+/melibiose symporter-like transporter